MRIITILVLAVLLAGCNVVFIPIPIDGLKVPERLPASDAALFWERYEAMEVAYGIAKEQMEVWKLDDVQWRSDMARLAMRWHDTIDILSATTQPTGGAWDKAGPMLDEALIHYGYAAAYIERAAQSGDYTLFSPARSELVQASTLHDDAMRLLGEE